MTTEPCPDHGVLTDADPGEEDGAAPQPDVVRDSDRLSGFDAGSSPAGVERVGGGQELHVRSHLDQLAERDHHDVEKDRPGVDEAAGSDVYLVAVVDVQGRHHLRSLAERPRQLGKQASGRVRLRGVTVVEAAHQDGGTAAFRGKLGVDGAVQVAGMHSLALGTRVGSCIHR